MGKVFSRKVISTAVASSLLFSVGGSVVFAAPTPKDDTKQTGRSEQNVQTGVIFNNDVTVERYQKEVRLSGTVVIDGPQLVFSISGVKSEDIKITKIGDKTWMYEAVVDVTAIEGDVTFNISANTVYANGKNKDAIHTSAPTFSQKIHVPYIVSTVAGYTEWTAYDRSSNLFTLAYDEVDNWSVGDPDVTEKSLTVSGLKDEVTVLDKTLDVPFAYQGLDFSDNPTWEFNESTKTYSGTVTVYIKDSKDVVTKDYVTKTNLIPGQEYGFQYSVKDDFEGISKTKYYTAPDAPEKPVASVVGLDNLEFKLVYWNINQFKVEAFYQIVYSDETKSEILKKDNFDGTIANPITGNPKNSTREYTIEGFTYIVTVHYDAGNNRYYTTYKLKN